MRLIREKSFRFLVATLGAYIYIYMYPLRVDCCCGFPATLLTYLSLRLVSEILTSWRL
jgi:hypothetical protein